MKEMIIRQLAAGTFGEDTPFILINVDYGNGPYGRMNPYRSWDRVIEFVIPGAIRAGAKIRIVTF